MNVAFRLPGMTRDEFFAWAERQEGRYEFDGFGPVAMTGGTFVHNQICQNLWSALRSRLRGGPCTPAGPDTGVGTANGGVRYPDALVVCAKVAPEARTVPAVVVFEVVSASSSRVGRIEKVRDYHATASILRYVILEYGSAGATCFHRSKPDEPWTAATLTESDTLAMPEIGIEVPVSDFYEAVEFPAA